MQPRGLFSIAVAIMPYCQAYGCTNKMYKEKDGRKRSYFIFPRVDKEKSRLERWLHNIGTGLTVKTFEWTKNRAVCSDHFHEECYKVNNMAKVLDFEPGPRKLKEGAVPTIFTHKTYTIINMNGDEAAAASTRVRKKEKEEVSAFEQRLLSLI